MMKDVMKMVAARKTNIQDIKFDRKSPEMPTQGGLYRAQGDHYYASFFVL